MFTAEITPNCVEKEYLKKGLQCDEFVLFLDLEHEKTFCFILLTFNYANEPTSKVESVTRTNKMLIHNFFWCSFEKSYF